MEREDRKDAMWAGLAAQLVKRRRPWVRYHHYIKTWVVVWWRERHKEF